MNNKNPKVEFYFQKENKWQKQVNLLRTIILQCALVEDLKWGTPCYTINDQNVVLIHTFKEYCALLFFKGALIKDKEKILIRQTENVHSSRQLRFVDLQEIIKNTSTIKTYIENAIEIEKLGLKVTPRKKSDTKIPIEFQQKLNENSALKKSFDALTPGRQRAYLLFFGSAKQAVTRSIRIEKNISRILDGLGLND